MYLIAVYCEIDGVLRNAKHECLLAWMPWLHDCCVSVDISYYHSPRTACWLCHHKKRAKMASTADYNLWDNHCYSIANFNFNLTLIRCSSLIFFRASRRNIAENKRVSTILCTQAGTCLLPCVNSDVVVMWNIPPPNSSPSFEVSAIFRPVKIQDIFPVENPKQYAV